MLRAAVLLALVAVACAVSPFPTNPNQVFATATRERFIPLNNNILLIAYAPKGPNYYRVVSGNFGQAANPAAPIRQYFGDAGRERFQSDNGNGIQPQSHLFWSQENPRNELVDPRFSRETARITLNSFLAVPQYDRTFLSVSLNVGDIVLVDTGLTATMLNGVTYQVTNIRNVKGVFTSGLRISDYPSHLTSAADVPNF